MKHFFLKRPTKLIAVYEDKNIALSQKSIDLIVSPLYSVDDKTYADYCAPHAEYHTLVASADEGALSNDDADYPEFKFGPPEAGYDIPVDEYFAMDEDGQWARYLKEPEPEEGKWWGDHVCGSGDRSIQKWPGWKDSLYLMTEDGLVKVET